jgi:ATP-binding cassette subfamily B multidrug efflux pump
MTLGEFVAFNGYLAMLTWPLMAVGYTVNQYQRGTAALSRLWEILDTPVSARYLVQDSSGVTAPIDGAIEFRHLTFSYGDPGTTVLRDINLSIPAGTICGIVGETGSGKSTLVNLLLRLFEPPDGAILIDGVDIKTRPPKQLAGAIGHVSQDIFLFSGTISENVIFGDGAKDTARIEDAARIAQLLPAIQEFSGRFETIIGERGVRLSGGQKQRTALARAIIKNPPILILDDAFSSVDVETEEQILRELRRFMRGRTTLLISHRVSTVRDADIILYLKAGAIAEQGSHAALVSRRGLYYELLRKQQLAREVATTGHGEARP